MNIFHEKLLECRLHDIDLSTEPASMSHGEALDFLERLSTDIQCRIDGIKDDMKSAAVSRP